MKGKGGEGRGREGKGGKGGEGRGRKGREGKGGKGGEGGREGKQPTGEVPNPNWGPSIWDTSVSKITKKLRKKANKLLYFV